ncbi:MAG TPA: FUSC family protein [Reyranella sp.]|nr:FUSC family protein [Reyranella sp.]
MNGAVANPPPDARWTAVIGRATRSAGPPLLFGLRLWAAVSLALYLAFWLELDNAYWAGTSAALVSQPHLGASMRKGWFRMIGTVVGAVVIVLMTAAFPQDRTAFLLSLALWGAACAFAATLLRNFAAYAAALAGYTAAIIASDELGATGGTNGQAFMLAVTRVSEIWLGIACAGIVLAGTDFGAAPRRLAALFAGLSAEIASRCAATIGRRGPDFFEIRLLRRELAKRVIALDPVIDEAIGESSRLRHHSPVLPAAVHGLLAALGAWRGIAVRLARLSEPAAQQQGLAVLECLPPPLRSEPPPGDPSPWIADPLALRRLYGGAIRKLIALPAASPSLRLLADQTARMVAGLCHALDGLALVVDDPARRGSRRFAFHVADWLPGVVAAVRAFIAIAAMTLFWIVSEWPNGAFAITWTAITVILFAPRIDEAYRLVFAFTVGNTLAAMCAAVILFAILPQVTTYQGFSLVLALYLIPLGALMAQPWQPAIFTPMVANIVPLLAPANPMTYDTLQFYNTALSLLAGSAVGALSFRLLPPPSAAWRIRRLLAFSLRDLRRLATNPLLGSREGWEARMYARLKAVPDAAQPVERAQLVAALSVGTAMIRLRRVASLLSVTQELESALAAFAQGNSSAAGVGLEELDRRLAFRPAGQQGSIVLRARGRLLLVCDALSQHHDYFDTGASP